MMSSLYPTLALTMAAAATTSVVAEIDGSPPPRRSMPYLRNDDLRNLLPKGADPSALENWMSIDKDVEFLPLLNQDPKAAEKMTPEATRKLEEEMSARKLWGQNNDPYSVQPFANGLSEYDEYQTAWRLLGFMVDCDTENDDDYHISYHSGDYNETEFSSENGCRRYVMWGAYVDTGYAGDGVAEYQYWDAKKHSWDKNACKYADSGNSRCAKMDCHLDNTKWTLLGVFKHNNYMEWFGQLFKHEGVCTWSEEQYAFMKTAKKGWPKTCTDTGHRVALTHNEYGNGTLTNVYYDVKPLQGGRMGLALYTDDECLEEHSTSTYHMESIIGNIFANAASHHSNDYQDDDAYENLSLKNALSKWDEAFKVWNTCHPCKVHDLENYDGTKYVSGDDYYSRKLPGGGGESDPTGEKFECHDDAGYTNVNQCMKFSAKLVMKTATFRDISLGIDQATLTSNPLSGHASSSKTYRFVGFNYFFTWFFLVVVSSAFVYSLWNLYKVSKETEIMPELKAALCGKRTPSLLSEDSQSEEGLENEENGYSEKSKTLI